MDWLRWWHGTVTDPKFQWVARKSGQPVGSVIAVWAALLECASTATQGNADATRGNVASFDCNDYDVALGFEDGTVKSIYLAMERKGLIADGAIAKWNERQPKREDSGNPNTGALSSTERSRIHREKKKREATQGNETQHSATLGNDREEESRGEESKPIDTSVVCMSERAPTASTPPAQCPAKSRKTPIPADFGISDRVAAWAADKGHTDLPQHLESFIGKCKAKGYKYVDWDAAFMGAIRDDWAGLSKGHEGHNGQRFDSTTYVNQHRRVA